MAEFTHSNSEYLPSPPDDSLTLGDQNFSMPGIWSGPSPWYDAENVRWNLKPGEVFIVQRISIAGKVVDLVGPWWLTTGDRIHLWLEPADTVDVSIPSRHHDENTAFGLAGDNE